MIMVTYAPIQAMNSLTKQLFLLPLSSDGCLWRGWEPVVVVSHACVGPCHSYENVEEKPEENLGHLGLREEVQSELDVQH